MGRATATPRLYAVVPKNSRKGPQTKTTVNRRRSGCLSSNSDVERGVPMALQQSDTPPPLSSQLNWPNKITLVRIFLVPLLLVFLISPAGWYPVVAATIFLVAAFTDWLDGHLARS